jgi:hypothetical protein
MRFAAMDDESNSRMALQALEQSIEGSPENETIRPMIRALFAIRFHWVDVARSELRFLFRPRLDMPAGSGYLSISGEAAAIAGTPEICARAHALLLPFEGRDSHTGHIPYSYEGPDARVIALLEARLGRTDVALERLGRVSERLRAHAQRSWLARTLVDRAQVLVDAGRSADAVAEEAIALSDSLGMRNLKARAEALVHRRGAQATPAAAAPARARSTALAPRSALLLLREGDTWRVTLGSREAHVKDSRGMEMLARLVAQPSERIHALVLVGGEDGAPDSDAGEMLDDAALRAYRARLGAIDEDIEEAELRRDQRRRAKLEAEKQAITDELSRAVGLGGRVRRAGSATERARVNATRRIKDALARIKEVEPTIGEHLEDSVRTGTYSCYRPTEPGR